jgi:hypothetical protein
MSHTDFDVVTGPSMPQRRALPQQRPSPSSETAAELVVPTPASTDRPDNAEEKRH